MTKPIYHMSGSGYCLRAIVAESLEYEPIKHTQAEETLLLHATRCENLAAMQMQDEGLEIIDGGHCDRCGRNGFHVEIEEDDFILVGHLDRKVIINGTEYPVEIKSLGRFRHLMFKKKLFEPFPEYATQEICYMRSQRKPGIYWVMSRDTGEPLKYIVNDFGGDLKIPGFTHLELDLTYNEIVSNLIVAQYYIQTKTLPDEVHSNGCKWCNYRYLCEIGNETLPEVGDLGLVQAANLYREGKDARDKAEDDMDRATASILKYAKESETSKFKITDIASVSYGGLVSRPRVDEARLKDERPDIYKQYIKMTKPFEDIRIYLKKGG